jgi:5-methylcytosine-specific restriction endonuclease McrA
MGYGVCKKQRDYQREWIKKRRDAWMQDHPVCVWCGSNINLLVHHLNPDLKVDHKVWSWAKKRRDEELAKCIVICTACHNREHHKPKCDLEMSHGTLAGYKTHDCRCVLCRQANRDYEMIRRMRKGENG